MLDESEAILGSPIKAAKRKKGKWLRFHKEYCFLSRDCSKGTIIKADHLTLRRPGTGILSHHLSGFIGGVLKSDLQLTLAMLKWSDLKDIK